MNLYTTICITLTPELKTRIENIKRKLGISQRRIMEKGIEFYEMELDTKNGECRQNRGL